MKNWEVALFGGVGARHRQRAALVGKAVARLIADGIARRLFFHAGNEAATLDHETGHDAVEDRAVVELRVDITEEVLHCDRRLVLKQLGLDLAQRRIDDDARVWPRRPAGAGGNLRRAKAQRKKPTRLTSCPPTGCGEPSE